MTIEEHKKNLKQISEETINLLLDRTLKKTDFLENIYQSGGKHKGFSEEFENAAVKERDEKCRVSSACYAVLREQYNKS